MDMVTTGISHLKQVRHQQLVRKVLELLNETNSLRFVDVFKTLGGDEQDLHQVLELLANEGRIIKKGRLRDTVIQKREDF